MMEWWEILTLLSLTWLAVMVNHFRLSRLEEESAKRTAAMDAWLRPKFTSDTDSAGDHLWGDTP